MSIDQFSGNVKSILHARLAAAAARNAFNLLAQFIAIPVIEEKRGAESVGRKKFAGNYLESSRCK